MVVCDAENNNILRMLVIRGSIALTMLQGYRVRLAY
jgi:hypothetical protein